MRYKEVVSVAAKEEEREKKSIPSLNVQLNKFVILCNAFCSK